MNTTDVPTSPLLVVGAGSWGTALALQAAKCGHQVRLWSRDPAHAGLMRQERENTRYLSGIRFPENLQIYADLVLACEGVTDILIAVPSVAIRHLLAQLKVHFSSQNRLNHRFILATKGFDAEKHQLLDQTLKEYFGEDVSFTILSGPSFAREVANGLPTAIVLSAKSLEFAESMRHWLHGDQFRIYLNDDIISTQLGAALKNVMAIAAGIGDGLGFGANARAALVTRSLAEMKRLALAMGGKSDTLMGLAGLGDLLLTCTDDQSRNRRFGLGLGKGLKQQEILDSIKQVVEGKEAAKIVHEIAKKLKIEMPILEQTYLVLYEEKSPREAVSSLFLRDPTVEFLQGM